MKWLKIVFLFFCFSASFFAEAQSIKSFSNTQERYVEEINILYDNEKIDAGTRKRIKEFMEVFSLAWNSPQFTEKHRQEVYKLSNLMLEKKMKALPHFDEYLSNLLRFLNSNQDLNSFLAWQRSLYYLLSLPRGGTKYFMEYQGTTKDLLDNNALYKSNTTEWITDNKDYFFTFDTVPKIVFKSLKLTCYSKRDSAVIYDTKGIFYPKDNLWLGIGGKVYWDRAGFDKNQVYAYFSGKYTMNIQYSNFKVDSVFFYNTNYFSEPLLGVLEERVLANSRDENASYPQFESYNKRFSVKNLFEGIDFDGGFRMEGAKILGSGTAEEPAKLSFYKEDTLFIKILSNTFLIRKDRISSSSAQVIMYLNKDSIYHPSLNVKYLKEKNELSLLRDRVGISSTPYFNTYHNLEMYFEAFYWVLTEPKIEFKMIRGVSDEGDANFESNDYYNEARFLRLKGIDEFHPLLLLKACAEKYKDRHLTLHEVTSFMKVSEEQVKALLINLGIAGFLIYNTDKDEIDIKDKLYHYIDSQKGKSDYDFLLFNSVIAKQSNATLNLLNYDMKLRGVESILLSDTQNVYVYPTDQELIVKKNRDFLFNGQVHAGLFDFYGNKFYFDYDKFKIEMPLVDSMSFQVRGKEKDVNGEIPLVRVKTVIVDIEGTLEIDYPKNKSGRKPFSQYPIFTSKRDSYVYYDDRTIQDGVYKRENFFFHVRPFVIDSLVRFSTEGLGFAGTMRSAGIFPNFDETLKVQEDYSLGFKRQTPPEGYPMYGGKGQFYKEINMSHNGLRGNGDLHYITSISKSNDFMFFPDSVTATLQDYIVKEQIANVEYPNAKGVDVIEQWYPYEDQMHVTKDQVPIDMYGQTKFHGRLNLTPESLTGKGRSEFRDAELESDRLVFNQHIINSDTADFTLKDYDLGQIALKTIDYKSTIDFEKRKGFFKSNGGTSVVEFPANKYKCYMDEFEWEMDKDQIDLVDGDKKNDQYSQMSLSELADVDLSGSRFVSTHPDQDSLEFFSPRAKFALKKNIIAAQDVKIIKVADAAIYPFNGEVTILPNAVIKTLETSQILANMATKYHTFYNATIDILSKKRYTATAKYDYINENKDKQEIYFDKVDVDTVGQTYGIGKIAKSAEFTLSPYFDYIGKVNLYATQEYLTFDGVCKVKHECDTLKSWIKFKDIINPNEIYISVTDSTRDINNDRISASMYVAYDSTQVSSSFMYKKGHHTYQPIINATGYLYYDKVSGEYRISNKDKLKELSLPGNFLSLGATECMVYGEGNCKALGSDLGQVDLQTYGNIKYDIAKDSALVQGVMSIQFFVNDNVTDIMGKSMQQYTGLTSVKMTNLFFTKALAEIMGTVEADKLISEISLYGAIKRLPPQLKKTLFLSEVNLIYDNVTKSYISTGNIGVGIVGDKQIHKYVKGYVQLAKKRGGDEFYIYLEPDANEWYFFKYKRGMMQILSSNAQINTMIQNEKSDNRTVKVKKGEAEYTYALGALKAKDDFMNDVVKFNEEVKSKQTNE